MVPKKNMVYRQIALLIATLMIAVTFSSVLADPPEQPGPIVYVDGEIVDVDWDTYDNSNGWPAGIQSGFWSRISPQGIWHHKSNGDMQLVGLQHVVLFRWPLITDKWSCFLTDYTVRVDGGYEQSFYTDGYFQLPEFDIEFPWPIAQLTIYNRLNPYDPLADVGIESIHTDVYFIEYRYVDGEIINPRLVYLWNVTYYDDMDDTDASNSSCFLKGTRVTMADGSYKTIEDIKIGDIVTSYNMNSKKQEPAKVTKVYHHEPKEMTDYYVILNDKLKVTPNHLLYVNDKLTPAGDVMIGDCMGNKEKTIKSIKRISEREPTYNIEIAPLYSTEFGAHLYYAEEILAYPYKFFGGSLYFTNEIIKEISHEAFEVSH